MLIHVNFDSMGKRGQCIFFILGGGQCIFEFQCWTGKKNESNDNVLDMNPLVDLTGSHDAVLTLLLT